MNDKCEEEWFERRRRYLRPLMIACGLFFFVYYLVLVIPKSGVTSVAFVIDNAGGSLVLAGFCAALILSKTFKNDVVLALPGVGAIFATALFLMHQEFYSQVSHLWLSAQIIGIIFAVFLGTPRINFFLLVCYALLPPVIAHFNHYLEVSDVVNKQAVVYFAGIISVYLSHQMRRNYYSLLRSRDKAQAAERAKTDFLANMSHEIRTPMNGVLGFTQLLSDCKDLTPEHRKYIKYISDSGTAMTKILNDIIDFSKIDAGMLCIDLHPVEVRPFLESVVGLHQVGASEKHLSLCCEVESGMPEWIEADSIRLRQILSNLVSNAVKFTREGEIKVKASFSGGADGARISFQVSDTGRGIERDKLLHIFDSFSQEDTSTTRHFGGAGLGLAISRQLTELMGGEIFVVSNSGQGSTFSFYVPVKQISAPQKAVPSPEKESLATGEPLHILLVEDNPVNRDLVLAYLKPLKVCTETAENGKVALEKIQHFTADIILMDCQMPVLDGYQATREIRKMRLAKQPVILAMTANAMEGSREACLDAGMDDYTTKPVSKRKLHALIKKWEAGGGT